MLNLLRFALLVVIAFLLVGVDVGITGTTGALEKVLLAAGGVVLLISAPRVRRIGRTTTA
jgi:hypothetical protein